MKFEAEKAKILLVEDNEINREVVLDILEPLNMHIDVAVNGVEAVEMILVGNYDLVFMDYLMPVMDGAKATKTIRSNRDRKDLKNLPIIALTASADETDRLLDAGMNDYIIKPITLESATKILVRWLSKGKVYAVDSDEEDDTEKEELPLISGIDAEAGIKNCGSLRLLKKLFKDYARVVDFKISQIEDYLERNLLEEYRIEVHALKSSSNLIGALRLSEDFAELERLAKENLRDELVKETPGVLSDYGELKNSIEEYSGNSEKTGMFVSRNRMINILKKIVSDADCFFLDGVDSDISELEKCSLPENIMKDFVRLKFYVADVSMGNIISTARGMIDMLEKNR